MMPTGVSSLNGLSSWISSFLACSRISLACRTSSTEEIMGYMILMLPCRDARRIALSWVLNSSLQSSRMRMAR
ncbi:hypothetical protein D3C76_1786430 [compost metagenome]